MTEKHSSNTNISYLAKIPNYRQQTLNQKHKLIDILTISLCGMISGVEDWMGIEIYAKHKEDFFKKFLELPNGIPSHDTLNRVFSFIDSDQFMHYFIEWMQSLFPKMDHEMIAIDGKTLRGSGGKKHSSSRAIHMVNAWMVNNGLVLGQLKTEAKSNEISAVPELLESLMLKGSLVSLDAMGCQKKNTMVITQKGADYLIAVKANQPKFFEAIQQQFSTAFHTFDYDETEELNRDRIEIRRCWVTRANPSLEVFKDWNGLTSLIKIESERVIKGEISIEHRYYICSSECTAEEMNGLIRKHWSIENSLHWVLDVAFREDECQVKKGNGAENLSRLRHIAINLIKQDKLTKAGIKTRRMAAGWNDQYLMSLLDGSVHAKHK